MPGPMVPAPIMPTFFITKFSLKGKGLLALRKVAKMVFATFLRGKCFLVVFPQWCKLIEV
jgi:hypothetical protein